jgi:hypothetical protein
MFEVASVVSSLKNPGKSSNPHYGDHFSGAIHLDQSLEQKL